MERSRYLIFVLPIIILAIVIEAYLYPKKRGKPFDYRELGTSLFVGTIAKLLNTLFVESVFSGFKPHISANLNLVQRFEEGTFWAVAFLLVEFFYYWHHRLGHEISWFWATHRVHHTPTQITMGNSIRLGWTGGVSGHWLIFAPLVFLGLTPYQIGTILRFNLLYQFWLHTELIPKLGPIEWVFNTPSQHRVHHALNSHYRNKNFGGVLSIFDGVFGTYQEEGEDCIFGVHGAQRTYNPFRIALDGWVEFSLSFLNNWNIIYLSRFKSLFPKTIHEANSMMSDILAHYRILMVEDDPFVGKTLSQALKLAGFQVELAQTVTEAKTWMSKGPWDIFLLDVNLPDGDGFSLCEHARRTSPDVHVMILSANADEVSALKGFESGAVEYMRKPTGPKEIIARIRKALKIDEILQVGSVHICQSKRTVFVNGKEIELRRREFDILHALAQKFGTVLNREELLNQLNIEEDISDRAIDVHLSRLRKKLQDAGANDLQITSIYGVGYTFKRAA